MIFEGPSTGGAAYISCAQETHAAPSVHNVFQQVIKQLSKYLKLNQYFLD